MSARVFRRTKRHDTGPSGPWFISLQLSFTDPAEADETRRAIDIIKGWQAREGASLSAGISSAIQRESERLLDEQAAIDIAIRERQP